MDPLAASFVGVLGTLVGVLGMAVKGLVETRLRPPSTRHEDIAALTISIAALTQQMDRQINAFERQGVRMDKQTEVIVTLSQGVVISNERLAQLLARRE